MKTEWFDQIVMICSVIKGRNVKKAHEGGINLCTVKGKENGKTIMGFDMLHMISLIHVYALAQIRQAK